MLATMWPARNRPRKPASPARRKQSASPRPGLQPSAAAQARATFISGGARPRILGSSVLATEDAPTPVNRAHRMTNVIAFPRRAEHQPRPQTGGTAAYEFTAAELAKLCRWYSAMKYAFPRLQGVMTVSHKEKVSAVGLYGQGGTTP